MEAPYSKGIEEKGAIGVLVNHVRGGNLARVCLLRPYEGKQKPLIQEDDIELFPGKVISKTYPEFIYTDPITGETITIAISQTIAKWLRDLKSKKKPHQKYCNATPIFISYEKLNNLLTGNCETW